MFAPVVIFFTIAIVIGCEARFTGGLSMTAAGLSVTTAFMTIYFWL